MKSNIKYIEKNTFDDFHWLVLDSKFPIGQYDSIQFVFYYVYVFTIILRTQLLSF